MRHQRVLVGGLLVLLVQSFIPPVLSQPLGHPSSSAQPNIIYIMTDDLDTSLVNYMSEVLAMREEGIDFTNFIVSNSQCCPSRAGYLTGKYPHNNHVLGNNWPQGGFGRFLENDEHESVGVYLDGAGYATGLMGKYLNEYSPSGGAGGGGRPKYPAAFVPAGWDEAWLVNSGGYQEFKYVLTKQTAGKPSRIDKFRGLSADNYLTDQLSDQAVKFIERHADQPFFLTLTPFATHTGGPDPEGESIRFPAAPRDRADSDNRPAKWGDPEFPSGDCGGPLRGGCKHVAWPPSPENFNQVIIGGASWQPKETLSPEEVKEAKAKYLDRVRMAQAVNDMISRIRQTLLDLGIKDDTYLMFGADNGFHLGDHALTSGKSTAYDHDARLPFVVVPPGGTTAQTSDELVSNIDLLPTFASIAGVESFSETIDGVSFADVLEGASVASAAHQAILIAYLRKRDWKDPDRELGADARIPSFFALRTKELLYIDYGKLDDDAPPSSEAEYFDLVEDRHQTINRLDDLRPEYRTTLNEALLAYSTCAGPTCRGTGIGTP